MKALFLWLFTLILVFVWIFFVIADIHAKKFENFSTNINKVTKFLMIFLLILSISGYLLIIFWNYYENPISNFLNKNWSSVKLEKTDSFENITY